MDGNVIIQDKLSQEDVDCITASLIGAVDKKPSPWKIEKLIKHAEINRPVELDTVPGITVLCGGKPQIIKRSEILPVDHPKSWQVRVGQTTNHNHTDWLQEQIARDDNGWSYRSTIPVLEKLKKPIPRADGNGYYLYRIVEGRHRFIATIEYDDFPCYVVEGHAADIEKLAGFLNNPDEQMKLANTEEDVERQINQQIVWYDKTNGKKGLEPEVLVVKDYLLKWYPTLHKSNRRRFASKCLAIAGIEQDVKDFNAAEMKAFLKDHNPKLYLNTGVGPAKPDSDGNYGFPMRYGRPDEERNSMFRIAMNMIGQYEKTGKVDPHYIIGTFSFGNGVNEDPTVKNMSKKREDARGMIGDMIVNFCNPLHDMYEKNLIPEPTVRYVPQIREEGDELQDK